MRVFVTGASGFVGRVVAREAANRGWDVLGISRTGTAPTDFPGKWQPYTWQEGAAPLASQLDEFAPDIAVHAAGSASVRDSFKDPMADFQASVGTWSLLLEATRISKVNPVVVFPSSAAIYGEPSMLPILEESDYRPVSPYGWHKHLCEELARAHAATWGTRVVVARMFSVVGPTQKRLLIWELFERLEQSGLIELLGTGQETRDYLHEAEMAATLLDLAIAQKTQSATGHPLIVNVASGKETSTREIARTLAEIIAPGCPISCRGEARPGDPERWQADTTLLRKLLKGRQPLSFETALHDTIRAWREERAGSGELADLSACENRV